MIAQILRDDAILQHPPEGDAVTAGRPRQLSGQCEIGREQQQAPATMVRLPWVSPETEIRRAETAARSSRCSTVRAAPRALRCASPRRKR
jgi:hypothetical protein